MSTSVHIRPLDLSSSDELTQGGHIMHLAFLGDAVLDTLFPAHLREASGYTDEKRLELAAQSFIRQYGANGPGGEGRTIVGAWEGETLLGVAIWLAPGVPIRKPEKSEEEKEKEKTEPEPEKDLELDMEALDVFNEELARVREKHMASRPHWYLKVLIIHPKAQRRGVGSRLLQWGIDRSEAERVPAVLEASPPGEPLYLRYGFEIRDTCELVPKDADGKQKDKLTWPFMVREAKGNQA